MPERKKILFVNYSLHSGGIEKSLVTVLSLFDDKNYEVDLQLFANEGLFFSRVPEKVHVLPPLFPQEYRLNIRKAFPALVSSGHPLLAICRLLVSFVGLRGTMGERLSRMWEIERRFVRPAGERYDAVVAFMEGQPLYYAVEKVNAGVKIGFIHGDYTAMGLCRNFDLPYVAKLDALCTVSESCKTALEKTFPGYSEKFHVIYNIISSNFLRSMAEREKGFDDGYAGIRVLSIARLSHQKGLDLAMPAVVALNRKGTRLRWYVIGVGPEEESLKQHAAQLGAEDCVVFLGERGNPYPFVRECDIYMQPSRFEGKAIAVDEAMVLCRPILLTDFSTASDQITSGENGLIVPMTTEGVEQGLESLAKDGELREKYARALSGCDFTNEDEINKLYALIENGKQ
ncbi:glycosyltransferase [Caproicibacter fermentans]|uniref:Glycosyltransferase n=1 Tax=Caproicibacter fermentans TaxID=2576756 RepID=A0A7G8TCY9_9FIRM|nr:glycosyltransferase [Caproicibacter fermentans]QNK41480.1 glycosyltransferase [Caproicibacter fermentans]